MATPIKNAIQGADAIMLAFDKLARKARENARRKVEVGYTAPYAVHVHEDLTIQHPNGEAKFLETPARLLRRDMAKEIETAVGQGATVEIAMFRAGELLRKASQELVPVDTGYLKSSAYTLIVER